MGMRCRIPEHLNKLEGVERPSFFVLILSMLRGVI